MFHYFLPGLTKATVAPSDTLDRGVLASLGLAEILADVSKCPADATVMDCKPSDSRGGGVLSGAGVLIAPTRKYPAGPVVMIDTGLQTWRESLNKKFWLGHRNGEPITPKNLERSEIVAGHQVADDVGNLWTVPIARAPQTTHPYGTLPTSYRFNEKGEPVPQLLTRFQWLWDLSGEIQDWYALAEDLPEGATPEEIDAHNAVKLPFSRIVQYAARLLGVNYRVGLDELNALDAAGVAVLTNTAANAICSASFGWEIADEAKKKLRGSSSNPAPSSSSSTTGGETPAAAPGIGQVAEH